MNRVLKTTLEIDFTFYQPLLNKELKPTSNYKILQSYNKYLRDNDRLILKVPQVIFAQNLWRAGKNTDNPNCLNAEMFINQFYDPANAILGDNLVGHVLSHWTWLSSLRKQFLKSDKRFYNSGKQCIIRLLTPLNVRYQDCYAQAHPFDKIIDGMMNPEMIPETVDIMRAGIRAGGYVNVILNNRAGGNAPLIARDLADKFLRT